MTGHRPSLPKPPKCLKFIFIHNLSMPSPPQCNRQEKMWKMELCPLRLTYFKKCRPGTVFTWLWLLHAPKYSEICQSNVQTTTQSTLMGSNFDNMDILQIIQQYLSNNILKSFYLSFKSCSLIPEILQTSLVASFRMRICIFRKCYIQKQFFFI